MKDTFSSLHPAAELLYFVLMVWFTLWLLHPACQLVSLCSAFAYSIYLKGGKAVRTDFFVLLPLLLVTALLNPLFSHAGVTILAYLPSGNPLTKESILYGLSAGTALAAVLCWFSCMNAVFTTDKFVYLFGRVTPALSLILSMSLNFIPRFNAQMRRVSDARKSLGLEGRKICSGLAALSAVIGWSMENAVETADSMRSRGYGAPGRTAYSIYRFDRRDAAMTAFLATEAAATATAKCLGAFVWRYYPSVKGGFAPKTFACLAAYAALCLMPLLLDVLEDKKWKTLRSRV